MRAGTRLAVDVGTVRVGLATSDPAGVLATPLETVPRDAPDGSDLVRIAALVAERSVTEVVVGLPLSLSGAEGAAAGSARAYAERIAQRVTPVPVRLVDERLSTVAAEQQLREAGVRARRHRPRIDQAAAVVLLQAALDAERASGRPPGSLVAPDTLPEVPAGEGEGPEDPVSRR